MNQVREGLEGKGKEGMVSKMVEERGTVMGFTEKGGDNVRFSQS